MSDSTFADLTIVLDRSGSMEACAAATIAGFNSFLDQQKAQPGQAALSLHQFDDAYETVYSGIPLAEVTPLDETTFVPRGHTRLLDAIGRTIETTSRRHDQLPEPQRPGRVLVAVITDGQENASTRFSPQRVSELIVQCKTNRGWQFVFIGTEQAAITDAAGWGVDQAYSIRFSAARADSVRGSWKALSGLSSRIRDLTEQSPSGFTDEERESAHVGKGP